jgi:hypothetical protein
MAKIQIIRKGDGTAFQNQNKQFVFVKDGVNFALSFEQMKEMRHLFEGLEGGFLLKVDPSYEEIVKGD